MDPALKKRLIGAIVLIVLAVIFLPMLFDGNKPSETSTVSLDIPVPPERNFETRVVALQAPTMPHGVADAVGVPAMTKPTTTNTESTAAMAAKPKTAESGDDIATVDISSSTSIDAVPAITAPVNPVNTNLDAISNTSIAANASSATKSIATEPAPVMSSAGRFVVNLGSYANSANAGQLEATLRALGLTVGSEPIVVDGKPVTRLRLGPFATRGLAEEARLKVKSIPVNLPLSITEIDDSPKADVTVPNPARQGVSAFAVQVEVLSDAAKANASRDRLRAAGFVAFVETLNTEKGSVYRVRVGPEANRSDAEKTKAGIRQRFGLDTIIVDYP